MFLVRKNPDCVGCQVTTSQSQYILATDGCWSLNQNTKFLPQGNIYIAYKDLLENYFTVYVQPVYEFFTFLGYLITIEAYKSCVCECFR